MLELATSVILLAQAFAPAASGGQVAIENIPAPEEKPVTISNSVTLEEYVREFFGDTPILAEIAKCESHFKQFNDDGTVLRGKVNKSDIGIMQINRYYHGEDAQKLGYDIYSIDGNLGYAKYLYEKSGDSPWVHSSKCWKNSLIALAK